MPGLAQGNEGNSEKQCPEEVAMLRASSILEETTAEEEAGRGPLEKMDSTCGCWKAADSLRKTFGTLNEGVLGINLDDDVGGVAVMQIADASTNGTHDGFRSTWHAYA